MKNILIGFIALCITISLWFIFNIGPTPEDNNSALTNQSHALKRQDFSLPDLNGQQQKFSQWNGKVVLLNFWATWCPPCRREMPDFIEVYDQFKNKDFIVVGVGIDNETKIAEFVDHLKVNYPILVGGTSALQVSYKYGNRQGALPYSIIIDKQGIIRYRAGGLMTRTTLVKQIKPLL